MRAFYNEIDTYCCDWLSNLMDAGMITAGDICDKSIEDVFPDELRGYDRCHFFAGIGVWDYALNLAGWGDRPVWTGSAPCQPFSAAGKGAGFDDERHLWPAWSWLIGECRPAVIVGEQVASKDIDPWIDLVQADVEAMGYAIGCVPFPSAGVGAPHIRDRAYFLAYSDHARSQGRKRVRERAAERATRSGGVAGIVADTNGLRSGRDAGTVHCAQAEVDCQGFEDGRQPDGPRIGSEACELADANSGRRAPRMQGCAPMGHGSASESDRGASRMANSDGGHAGAEGIQRSGQHGFLEEDGRIERIEPAGPTNGFWRDADRLSCRDGKWRPVEPGYEQMADGSASSLGRVRTSDVEEITEEINAWSIRHQADAGEALRRVWADLQSQALCEREAGRFSGVQSPAVLLAFLRQLTNQGWRFSISLACAGTEASRIVVRIMQFDAGSARTPLRRELEEQLAGQPADPLQELSSIVASHAAQRWGEACRKKAGAASFPLADNASARVGRLRAYGNAINAEAAAEFIRAAREVILI